MPGEAIEKSIYINVEGIVYFFVAETWFVLVIEGNVTIEIKLAVETYPVRSADVLTTLPEMPVADEVEVAAKLMHLTV